MRGPEGAGMADGLTGEWVGYVAAALLIAALSSARLRMIRIGAMLAGLVGFAQAVLFSGDWIAAILAAGLAFVCGYQLIDALRANGRARLSGEERAFAAAMLPGLGRAQLRDLLDQGYWMDARPGDILTREGEPVPHLYYLADGGATVFSAMRAVGHCGPGSFVGEVTVLSGDPATGTVEVDAPSRLWCAPAAKLRLYVDHHDEIRRAIESAFRRTLAAKLVASNRRLAEG